MKNIYRHPSIATAAVILGLGSIVGGSLTGCGEEQTGELHAVKEFDLCPSSDLKTLELTPQDEASKFASDLACFLTSQPGATGASNDRLMAMWKDTPVFEGSDFGRYVVRITAPSIQEVVDLPRSSTHINLQALSSVSIEAQGKKQDIFSYRLSRQLDDWRLSSEFNKDGLHYDFDETVSEQNIEVVRGLSQMAVQIACFTDHDIPSSNFHPTFVQFNNILEKNCLPKDHVGTPKTLLPVFGQDR
jgi:hypothetical protein